MLINTVVTVLPASKNKVFSYLADINNLPRWATEFCEELRKENGKYRIRTCTGADMFFRIDADEKTGTIDMHAGPAEDQMATFPTRVVSVNGQTAFIFTMFKAPEMPKEAFQQQADSLSRELENVKKHFSAGNAA